MTRQAFGLLLGILVFVSGCAQQEIGEDTSEAIQGANETPAESADMPGTMAVQATIAVDEAGPIISRYLYGQFAEHLGRGIYQGLWVGEQSAIPNTRGFRNDVLAALRELEIPVIRWPGGCFADGYHWRDGIGPRQQRPVRINYSWGGVEESNAVGTHEFFDLVELLGSEAYIAGNLGSGSPQEMAEWLEYITSDSNSSLAQLRRKNGRSEPWRVAFWGVGNESWGCGGNMEPEFYAHLYKRFTAFLNAPAHNSPKLIASGGYTDVTKWTDVLSTKIHGNIDGISHHYYTLPTGDWGTKGAATGFGEAAWIETLHQALLMQRHLEDQVRILERNDPEGNIGLYMDEWGTWYDPEPAGNPSILYQQNTLRDGLVAAVHFHIFHEYAERVHMANIAQMVNVLQAMVLTDEDEMVLTPTYHVFRMYKPFKDSRFLPVQLNRLPEYSYEDRQIPAVSASAAQTENGEFHLAVTNLDPERELLLSVDMPGYRIAGAGGEVLTATAMDAHNSFTNPDRVVPKSYRASKQQDELILRIPAKAVLVVELDAELLPQEQEQNNSESEPVVNK